jgi:mannan polymerase II complex MNN10 subunit
MVPTYKGKPQSNAILSSLMIKFSRSRLLCLACTGTIVLALGVHRLASVNMERAEAVFVKAPINDIARECPATGYPVLGDKGKLKICLTTLTDAKAGSAWQKMLRWRNFDSLLDMTWPNKQTYVEKHGYHLYDESQSLDRNRPPSWSKIRAAQRLLKEERCDWVFWLDADTVVMNSSKRVEDFLPSEEGKDLIITSQKGGSYNAGAWLIKNTPWSLEFLDHWWNMKDFVKPMGMAVSGDNDALKAYLLGMEKEYFDAHIVVPPRCTFNSVAKFLSPAEVAQYEGDIKEAPFYKDLQSYHKGDFIAHIAGKNNKIDTTAMILKDAI